METSLFLAQVLAICYLSIGIGFFISRDYYKKELYKLMENPGFMLLGGYMTIIIGALMVYTHNVWVSDWTVLITLIGWIALIKGVWLIIFPQSATQFRTLVKPKNHSSITTIVLAMGLVFGYFGFFN